MTVELACLLVIVVLAASMWLPFIVGVNMLPAEADGPDIFVQPRDPLTLPPWIARAYRAHQNLLEQSMPFAVAVLLTLSLGISTAWTKWACILFVGLRIAHALGMITGVARFPARPIIFTAGYATILVLVWQIVAGS